MSWNDIIIRAPRWLEKLWDDLSSFTDYWFEIIFKKIISYFLQLTLNEKFLMNSHLLIDLYYYQMGKKEIQIKVWHISNFKTGLLLFIDTHENIW